VSATDGTKEKAPRNEGLFAEGFCQARRLFPQSRV
jgi:hypothetical protein